MTDVEEKLCFLFSNNFFRMGLLRENHNIWWEGYLIVKIFTRDKKWKNSINNSYLKLFYIQYLI